MTDPTRETTTPDAVRFPVVRRCCGTGRQAGGVYAETGIGEGGVPIERFLLDPPRPVPDTLKLPARGVMLVEQDGVWHVLDHVGSEHYPNVADFIEEARRAGVSRRLPRNIDFSKLTRESRLVFAHRRAIIADPGAYRPADGEPYPCPCGDATHAAGGDVMCAGLWWEDMERDDPTGETEPQDRARRGVRREIADASYDAMARPLGVAPQYTRGFFLSVPLGRIAVVDDGGRESAETFAKVSAAQCPTALVPL